MTTCFSIRPGKWNIKWTVRKKTANSPLKCLDTFYGGIQLPLSMLKSQQYRYKFRLDKETKKSPMLKIWQNLWHIKISKFLKQDIRTNATSEFFGGTGVESSTTCALDGGRCVGLGESVLLKRRSLIAVNLGKMFCNPDKNVKIWDAPHPFAGKV